MRIFYNKKFTGHYPVGSAAIVVAENPAQATELLNLTLKQDHHLDGDAEEADMVEIDPKIQRAIVVLDGNY